MKQSHHLKSIDGLKGVAILFIMLQHALPYTVKGGSFFVVLFFVISGHLAGMSLIKSVERRDTHPLLLFYKKRFVRLMPTIVIMIGIFAIITSFFNHLITPVTLLEAIASLSFTTNWVTIFDLFEVYYTRHLWYTAVLAQTFLIIPLILLPLLRKKRYKDIAIGIAMTLPLLWVWRFVILFSTADYEYLYLAPEMRIDALLAGMLLAVCSTAYNLKSLAKKYSRTIVAGINIFTLLMLAYLSIQFSYGSTVYYLFLPILTLYFTFLLFQALMIENAVTRLLNLGPLVYIGRISFPLYIFHYPVIILILSLVALF